MKFHVDIHHHQHDETHMLEQLILLNLKLDKTMALIDDLNAKVAEVQTALDDVQAKLQVHLDQDAATIAALNQQIADLQALLAAGATAPQLQTVIDGLTAVVADIQSTTV